MSSSFSVFFSCELAMILDPTSIPLPEIFRTESLINLVLLGMLTLSESRSFVIVEINFF